MSHFTVPPAACERSSSSTFSSVLIRWRQFFKVFSHFNWWVALICISLMSNDGRHLFVCSISPNLSSLMKWCSNLLSVFTFVFFNWIFFLIVQFYDKKTLKNTKYQPAPVIPGKVVLISFACCFCFCFCFLWIVPFLNCWVLHRKTLKNTKCQPAPVTLFSIARVTSGISISSGETKTGIWGPRFDKCSSTSYKN